MARRLLAFGCTGTTEAFEVGLGIAAAGLPAQVLAEPRRPAAVGGMIWRGA